MDAHTGALEDLLGQTRAGPTLFWFTEQLLDHLAGSLGFARFATGVCFGSESSDAFPGEGGAPSAHAFGCDAQGAAYLWGTLPLIREQDGSSSVGFAALVAACHLLQLLLDGGI